MATTRTPGETFTPGENAGHKAEPRGDTAAEAKAKADAAETAKAGAPQAKTTEPLQGTLEEQVAAMKATQDEMLEFQRALMAQNQALMNQVRSANVSAPEAPELPKVATVRRKDAAGELDAPVLTEEGWYVPRVTSANPEQQAGAQLAAAARAFESATKAAKQ